MSSNHSKILTLLVCRVVVKNLIDFIIELIKVRTNWTPEFAADLIEEIDSVGDDLIGLNAKKALFEATDNLHQVMAPSQKDITSLKIQLDLDYKKNPIKKKLIYDDLGYSNYYKGVKNDNQVSLIGLLLSFKKNIGIHKAEIIANGTPVELLDRILGYAEVVNTANTIQEQLKTSSKMITAEASAKLTALYEKVIKICIIAPTIIMVTALNRKCLLSVKLQRTSDITSKLPLRHLLLLLKP